MNVILAHPLVTTCDATVLENLRQEINLKLGPETSPRPNPAPGVLCRIIGRFYFPIGRDYDENERTDFALCLVDMCEAIATTFDAQHALLYQIVWNVKAMTATRIDAECVVMCTRVVCAAPVE